MKQLSNPAYIQIVFFCTSMLALVLSTVQGRDKTLGLLTRNRIKLVDTIMDLVNEALQCPKMETCRSIRLW